MQCCFDIISEDRPVDGQTDPPSPRSDFGLFAHLHSLSGLNENIWIDVTQFQVQTVESNP